MTTIRILLVDDHAVVRSGLSKFLMVNKDLELVAEASDGFLGLRNRRKIDKVKGTLGKSSGWRGAGSRAPVRKPEII